MIEITGNTCKVSRENLPTLEDVRLNAIEGDFSNKIIIYPAIGSGVAMSGYEMFPSGFSVGNYNASISYRLFNQCNITNSNAIAYQWGNPYYYNAPVGISIDFNPSTGSFITC